MLGILLWINESSDRRISRGPRARTRRRTSTIKLNWLARSAGPGDLVILYFTSHGLPGSMDAVAGNNYFITYDTDISDNDLLFATALPLDLSSFIRTRLRAQTAVFFLAPHSAAKSRGSYAPVP